jgi:hypothetical protein
VNSKCTRLDKGYEEEDTCHMRRRIHVNSKCTRVARQLEQEQHLQCSAGARPALTVFNAILSHTLKK